MPGAFEQYKDQVAKFNSDYGVDFSYEAYEIDSLKMQAISVFLGAAQRTNPENTVYRGMLLRLYRNAVVNKIENSTDNEIDPIAFLEDFDNLMLNYREHCVKNNKEAPDKRGGWLNNAEIADAMQQRIADIKGDRVEYYKDKYMLGKIRLRDMRADVARIQSNPPASAKDIARAMIYMRALQKITEERSRWWGIIHPFRSRAEVRDYNTIQDFVISQRQNANYAEAGAIADRDYVSSAREGLTAMKAVKIEKVKDTVEVKEKEITEEKVNETTEEKVNETTEVKKGETTEVKANDITEVKKEETTEVKKEAPLEVKDSAPVQPKIDEKPKEAVDARISKPVQQNTKASIQPGKKEEPKPIARAASPKPTAEQKAWAVYEERADKIISDPAVSDEMVSAISKKIGPSALNNVLASIRDKLVFKRTQELARDMWNVVKEQDPAERERKMAESARDFFIAVYTSVTTYKLDTAKHLAVSQMITDMAINKFSPVAFDDKLAKYGNSYFMNTVSRDTLQALVGIEDFETGRKVMLEAKSMIASEREPLDLSAHFGEKAGSKAPKIETEAPKKSLGKDI